MSKSAIIIYRVDKSEISNAGVVNKLNGQVEGLASCNYKVDYVICDKNKIFLNQQLIHQFSELPFGDYKKINFYNCLGAIGKYDIYIIRYSVATPAFAHWLSGIRAINPNCKIVIDMPTYPYASEWKGLKGKLVLMMDKWNRKSINKQVDLMIHSGKEQQIYGIPTYHMTNGLLSDQIMSSNKTIAYDILTMVAVGKWQHWHGLDRLLIGLSKYDQPYHLHVIGEGNEDILLKRLAQSLQLETITWHGSLVGEGLLDICRKADLAIGTLGLHRKGVSMDSSLKHRTYCGLGIPFVLSSKDTDFPQDLNFVQYVSVDDSPIDVAELSNFVSSIDYSEVQQSMTRYAEKNLRWESKMKKLAAYIEAT